MSESINMVYWLEPISEEAGEHLHKCPVAGCGHEMILRKAKSGAELPEVGAIAYRTVFDENGESREVVNIRLPGLCWCGAPLPQSKKVVFLSSDIKENRAEAVRILQQHQTVEQEVAEVAA